MDLDTNNSESDKLITETGVSYRDSVSNIDSKGKRIWIYPAKPSGRFHKARLIVGLFLTAIFFTLPLIKYKGAPYFLINVFERKFIFFGTYWFPQDFYIFAIGLLTLAIFIVLFTAVFGRIWCGWACPQTVTMELLIRKIEFFIEGNASQQKALKKAPMSVSKFFKKFTKHFLFLLVAFIVNFFVFAYIISFDSVIQLLTVNTSENTAGISAFIFITLAFYGNYSWFREQSCTFVCPYGRLQSVLLDKNSIIVAYDNVRGEPRGKLNHGQTAEGKGDCIDCGACVRVCPTGIDIRNGLQLECVNCTACIDECDSIMDKIKKPRGLIKYSSILNIEKGIKFKFTSRMTFYSILLLALLSVFVFMVVTREDVEATILRAKGSTYIINEDGNIVNVFTVKLINKTLDQMNITFKTENHHAKIKYIGTDSLIVKPEGILEGTFLLEIPGDEIKEAKNKIKIQIYSGDRKIGVVKTNFSGPESFEIHDFKKHDADKNDEKKHDADID